MSRNDKEHADICQSIAANAVERRQSEVRMLHIFQRSRIWSIAVMLFGMVGVGVMAVLFSLLSRGVLP